MSTKVANGLDLNNQRIQNVGDASAATDVVTLQQMQAYLRGLDYKDPVRAATTGPITLSGTQTIDGVSLVAGDRVLVKNQAAAATNGIYVVAASAWTRAVDADDNFEVTPGLAVTVVEGTNKGGTVAAAQPLLWTLTNNSAITLGTTALNFAIVGGGASPYTAGNGLTLSGGAFSAVSKAGGGLGVDSQGIFIDPALVARKYVQAIGDGSAVSIVVTHNLGTLDVVVTLIEVATGAQWIPDVSARTTNSVTLAFATAPAAGAFRVRVAS